MASKARAAVDALAPTLYPTLVSSAPAWLVELLGGVPFHHVDASVREAASHAVPAWVAFGPLYLALPAVALSSWLTVRLALGAAGGLSRRAPDPSLAAERAAWSGRLVTRCALLVLPALAGWLLWLRVGPFSWISNTALAVAALAASLLGILLASRAVHAPAGSASGRVPWEPDARWRRECLLGIVVPMEGAGAALLVGLALAPRGVEVAVSRSSAPEQAVLWSAAVLGGDVGRLGLAGRRALDRGDLDVAASLFRMCAPIQESGCGFGLARVLIDANRCAEAREAYGDFIQQMPLLPGVVDEAGRCGLRLPVATAAPPVVRRTDANDRDCCDGLEACLDALRNVDDPDFAPPPPTIASGSEDEPWVRLSARGIVAMAPRCSMERLAELGAPAADRLVALLEHSDSRVRDRAAATLGSMLHHLDQVMPALIRAYEADPGGHAGWVLSVSNDPRALEALVRQGAWARPRPKLTAFGHAAVVALAREVVSASGDARRLEGASTALMLEVARRIEDSPRVLATLTEALVEARAKLDRSAPRPRPQGSAPRLFDEQTTSVDGLLWALDRAVEFVGGLRATDAEAAFVAVLPLVDAADPLTRSLARKTAADLAGLEHLDVLARLSEDGDTRSSVARRAIQLGPAAAALAPSLAASLKGPRWDGRAVVAQALGVLGDPVAVPALTEALASRDFRVNLAAAKALAELGPSAAAAAAALEALAETHWSDEVRAAAADALASITGRKVEPREGRWQRIRDRREQAWSVESRGRTIEVRALASERGNPNRTSGEGHDVRIAVPEGFLIARPDREAGSSLHVLATGATEEREQWRGRVRIRELVSLNGRVIALADAWREGGPGARLLRIEASASGCSVEQIVGLPGNFRGYAIESPESLVVVMDEAGEGPGDQLGALRVTADGQVEALSFR